MTIHRSDELEQKFYKIKAWLDKCSTDELVKNYKQIYETCNELYDCNKPHLWHEIASTMATIGKRIIVTKGGKAWSDLLETTTGKDLMLLQNETE
jgi:hypothetical protein